MSETMEVLASYAAAVGILESAPDQYCVLRRFQPRLSYGPLVGDIFHALVVDVEGTGLDAMCEEIIQFAGIKFEFDRAGHIGRVVMQYCELEEPSKPLDPEVVAVTGLTDDMLKGHTIDDAYVAKLLEGVSLVVAHNADYDRKMIERRFARSTSLPDTHHGFTQTAWACSQRDVEWKDFDCQYIGLEYLLMKACREFFDAHNALGDAAATLHVLAHPRTDDEDSRSPFQLLLDSVREPTLRLSAWDSPFETKDVLRLRRFRWNANARVWQKDLKQSQLGAEKDWLLENVYWGGRDLSNIAQISRKNLYSVRA